MARFRIVPLSEVPTDSVLGCDEKARLVRDYDNATLAFSNAVQEMHRKIRTSPRDEYQRLERISHEARVKSEQTRLALEQHIATHRCQEAVFVLQAGQLSLCANKRSLVATETALTSTSYRIACRMKLHPRLRRVPLRATPIRSAVSITDVHHTHRSSSDRELQKR